MNSNAITTTSRGVGVSTTPSPSQSNSDDLPGRPLSATDTPAEEHDPYTVVSTEQNGISVPGSGSAARGLVELYDNDVSQKLWSNPTSYTVLNLGGGGYLQLKDHVFTIFNLEPPLVAEDGPFVSLETQFVGLLSNVTQTLENTFHSSLQQIRYARIVIPVRGT